MNVGRLAAKLVVLAVIIYCCYSAIVEAIPTNGEDLTNLMKNPVSVDQPQVSAAVDGIELKVTVETEVTSHFPQDVDDVYLKILLGEQNTKILLGQVNLGVLQPNVTKHVSETLSIPLYLVASYAICTSDGDGLKLPLCAECGFKYFKWNGDHLIDLGITLKYTTEISGATVSAPTVYGDHNENAKMTVDITSADVLKDAIDALSASDLMDGGKVTLTCGGAEFVITPDGDNITFDVHGADGKNAVEVIKKAVAENDGKLQFACAAYSGDIPPVTGDNVDAFLSILEVLYAGGSA